MKRNQWVWAGILCATSACATSAGGRAGRGGGLPETIRVTGCVQNHGAKSSATMDGGYLLTNTVTGNASGLQESAPGSVSPPPRGDAPPSAGTGSSGTAAAPVAPARSADVEPAFDSASYMLNGRDSELRNYIDHRVEITGTLEINVDVPGDANATPTRGSRTTRGRNTGLQWFRVASVKTISSDCSARR